MLADWEMVLRRSYMVVTKGADRFRFCDKYDVSCWSFHEFDVLCSPHQRGCYHAPHHQIPVSDLQLRAAESPWAKLTKDIRLWPGWNALRLNWSWNQKNLLTPKLQGLLAQVRPKATLLIKLQAWRFCLFQLPIPSSPLGPICRLND